MNWVHLQLFKLCILHDLCADPSVGAGGGAEAPGCCRLSRMPSAHTWELSSVSALRAFAASFTASCCKIGEQQTC